MSYWSHNTEAWDEICYTGLARHFLSAAGFERENSEQYEATEEAVIGVFCELEGVIYEARGSDPGNIIWHRLLDCAREEIRSGEQAHFEGYVP